MFVKVGTTDDNQWFVPDIAVRCPAAFMGRSCSGRPAIRWQSSHLTPSKVSDIVFGRQNHR
jgi:hypothetical protein